MEEFITYTLLYLACWAIYLARVGFKIPSFDFGVLMFVNGLPIVMWLIMLAKLINE